MKRCPACQRTYTDDTLKFCRDDGEALYNASSITSDFQPTVDLSISQSGAVTAHQTLPDSHSIAVLPFAHMSADPDNDYFCDGLAEELLNALAKLEGLKVAARTSTFFFKGKDAKITEIGEALNVSTVLEGSVRKSGNRLRITAQLINVSDGYHLWSERYDRQMEDVFDIQDEITLAIVDALKVKLLGEDKTVMLNRHADNTEAYESYLKGRYHLNKFTVEDWKKAIDFFEEAISKESGYAPAYAGTALCWNALWYYGCIPPHEIVPKWKAATSQALELDSNLAEAHLSLANMRFLCDWDWEAAEREYKRALELNPNSVDSHWSYGTFLVSRGRPDHAISEGVRALELDPLSLLVNMHVGAIYWLANRMDNARSQARKLIEIEPNFYGAYWLLGGVYATQGMYEEAIEAYQGSLARGGNYIVLSALGWTYGTFGNREEASGVINQLLEVRKHQYLPAFYIARVYRGLGDNDATFEWLEKAYEERNGEMVFLDVETSVGTGDALRKDPRFPALLRRVGMTA